MLIEVANEAEWQALPSAADVAITWLYRDGLPLAENDLLLDAVRAIALPDEPLYIWGGGEFRAMTAIKKYLQDERGIDERRDLDFELLAARGAALTNDEWGRGQEAR